MLSLEQLFERSVEAQSLWIPLLAFIGGVVSSLLPCSVGMLPILLGYVTQQQTGRFSSLLYSLSAFILGIALVMTLLGVVSAILGVAFGSLVGSNLYYLMALVLLLAGAQMLEWIHLPLPQLVTALPQRQYGQWLTPIVLGVFFGLTASPCGTPFLAGILGLISLQGNILLGGLSLFCYALGQGTLLLVVGLFAGALTQLNVLRQWGHQLNVVSAAMFLLAGLYLLLQATGVLNQILLRWG